MTGDIGGDPTETPTEALRLTTSDGHALEAEVRVPPRATAAVLLAHPHPQQGGSMRSLVTSELFRALPGRGLAVLRFNFRGVEGSEGSYGGGVDEQADIVAGLDGLAAWAPGLPVVVAGWSFGADTSLAVVDDRIDGWCPIAPPLRILPVDAFAAGHDPRPKCLIVPEHDQFRPPAGVRELTAGWVNTEVHVIAGGDHFLAGRTGRVVDLLVDFAARVRPDGR